MEDKNLIEIKSLSIVLVGNFNPAIIHPSWLANKKLIREKEAEEASVEVIHDEYASFNLGWAKIQVWLNKFVISTEQEPYFDVVKDLCLGIFGVLRETPISALGINNIIHLKSMPDEMISDIANKVLPLSSWSFLNSPSLLNIEIVDQNKPLGDGMRRIGILRSDRLPNALMFRINDHFELQGEEGTRIPVSQLITENWDKSLNGAEEIVLQWWNHMTK